MTSLGAILALTASLLVVAVGTAGADVDPSADFTICAKPGTATMVDGSTADIWGFAAGECAVAGAATLPGPTLSSTAAPGTPIRIEVQVDTLMPENVNLQIPGLNNDPEFVGSAPGDDFTAGSLTYEFEAREGTFLYGSDLRPTHALMGLFGVLDIRPTAGSLHGFAYQESSIQVLSEIDPDFNADVAVGGSSAGNLLDYSPTYYLMNGVSHDGETPSLTMPNIIVDPSDRLQVTYLNAGTLNSTMASVGQRQQVIAQNGDPLSTTRDGTTVFLGAGQSADVLIDVVGQPDDTFPLMNRNFRGFSTDGVGSQLTFIEVAEKVYFSTTIGAVATASNPQFNDEDVLAWDGTNLTKFFDGSVEGLPANADIDALHVVDDDTLLMSFMLNGGTVLPGGLVAQDEDIVLYDAGTWSIPFVGLDFNLADGNPNAVNAEDIDALYMLDDGSFVISTVGNVRVLFNRTRRDEDLLRFTPTAGSLLGGGVTAGTWSNWYFDGSDVGIFAVAGEDINAADEKLGDLYFSTQGDTETGYGLILDDDDIGTCDDLTPGAVTACNGGSLFLDGVAAGLLSQNDIDGLTVP